VQVCPHTEMRTAAERCESGSDVRRFLQGLDWGAEATALLDPRRDQRMVTMDLS
jgi:hypothetical protein